MISASESFAEAIGGTSRRFRGRLLINGSEAGQLRRMTVHLGSCGAAGFTPGAVFSSYAEITVAGEGLSFEGQALELQLGVLLPDGSYEYIALGRFTAGRPAASVHETSFTAYGGIEAYFTDTFEPPQTQTLENIIAALETQTGTMIALRGLTAEGSIDRDMTGLTCREALAAVAGVLGGYAAERWDGAVVLAKYTGTVTAEADGERMTSLPTFADRDATITGVSITVPAEGETEETVYTSGTSVLDRTDVYMTEALFSAYAGNLVGLTWRPGTVRLALGDPRLEPWDALAVTDTMRRTFTVPCMSIVHSFDGGLITEVRAPGLAEGSGAALSTTGRALRQAQSAAAAAAAAAATARAAAAEAEAASRALEDFLEGEYAADIAAIQSQIDGKAETWYQSSDPSGAWTTAALKAAHKGDLWYDSTSSVQKYYRWNGSAWSELTATPPDAVFDAIDGKAQIFVSTPTPPYEVGDLWFQSATSDILTCVSDRTSGSYTASDWQKRNKYTDDSALTTFVSSVYDPAVASLEAAIDGKIDTYFYAYAPTLSNPPASGWTDADTKNAHLDDLFYNTSTGYCYRFTKSGSAYLWSRVKDGDITSAMSAASAAQDTADGKRRVFVGASSPTPPYDVGDLWAQGASGDLYRCAAAKTASGSYAASDWVLATKYTDDSALHTFMNGTYASDLASIQTQVDGKAETWYQTADPSSAWTTAALKAAHKGDLWYDSSASVQKYYRWNGSAWSELTATPPDAVFDAIDGKAQIFVSTPTVPYYKGDLWFQSASSDILTCVSDRTSGSYTASDWQKRNKYTDDTTADLANDRATAARGVCSTAAATSAKTVVSTNFVLTQGAAITVYNSTANTASGALTLNVNSTGAKTICAAGEETSASNKLIWAEGSSITYVYDGACWCVENKPAVWYAAACSAAAGTYAKSTSVSQAVIFKGTTLHVPMTYANTTESAYLRLTLTAGGTVWGSNIYCGSGTTVPTTANGHGWVAGRTAAFYFDGAYWRLGETSTIIDGGHIMTGTIDASVVNVTNLDAGSISTGTLSADRIKLYGKMGVYTGSSSTTVGGFVGYGGVAVGSQGAKYGGLLASPGSKSAILANDDLLYLGSTGGIYTSNTVSIPKGFGIETYNAASDSSDEYTHIIPHIDGNIPVAKLLYENSSPTASVAANTRINIAGLSDYDIIMIEVAYSTTYTSYRAFGAIQYSSGAQLRSAVISYSSTSGTMNTVRNFTIYGSYIVAGEGAQVFGSSVAKGDAYAIPTKVIGIRYTAVS